MKKDGDSLRKISKRKDPEASMSYYKELGYPAITSTLSKEGITKASVVKGYKTNISIIDKLYINNDAETAELNSGANVLIFDEVTNHLDMETITALNEGMKKFKGNMIFASHDHQLTQTESTFMLLHSAGGEIDANTEHYPKQRGWVTSSSRM